MVRGRGMGGRDEKGMDAGWKGDGRKSGMGGDQGWG